MLQSAEELRSYNTTTSMGRPALNVLLSFARFERVVTGERIRDRIAASQKMLRMGVVVPLVCRVEERKWPEFEPVSAYTNQSRADVRSGILENVFGALRRGSVIHPRRAFSPVSDWPLSRYLQKSPGKARLFGQRRKTPVVEK